MKVVLTYGTFDLFHYGHLLLLERAKLFGDKLIVGLSTDEFNSGKGKKSFHSFEQRRKNLEAIRFVDLVIPENTWEQKIQDVLSHNVDIFIMGDDWEGKFDFLKEFCEVMYLPRTPDISSSLIKTLENK
ncbi:glycerol-3-phosphate cytidylyltransferase [Flectobacillus roseus]